MEWLAGGDPACLDYNSYSAVSDDDWFHIYCQEDGSYKIISRRIVKTRRYITGKPVFSNRLDQCIKWVKGKNRSK
jgi:hypothetical protein